MTTVDSQESRAVRLSLASALGSAIAAAALVAVGLLFDSALALAQAADSANDVLAGGVLVWATRLAHKPADAEHPRGHASAEPIAALVVAVLAGVLAAGVAREAITAISTGEHPRLEWPLAAVFTGKVALKLGVLGAAAGSKRSPGLDALRVDARNDVLLGALALLGFGLALAGLPAIDAWLALLVAVYVGWSGFALARENVSLLLGRAVAAPRHGELVARASAVEGVRAVRRLVATQAGAMIHVVVDVAVDPDLSVARAHDIAHAVEAALTDEEDVQTAVAHVEPATRP